MHTPEEERRVLHTSAGEFPLNEYRLRAGGREWTILHVGSVLTREDENRFLGELKGRLPYGVALLAMSACRRNGARNRVGEVEHRLSDWAGWEDGGRYDWILGSDILYGEELHPHLRRIFETNLAPGGRVLLSDPFRAVSLRLLEALEGDGWTVTLSKWSVGEEATPRPVAVFELTAPCRA